MLLKVSVGMGSRGNRVLADLQRKGDFVLHKVRTEMGRIDWERMGRGFWVGSKGRIWL